MKKRNWCHTALKIQVFENMILIKILKNQNLNNNIIKEKIEVSIIGEPSIQQNIM